MKRIFFLLFILFSFLIFQIIFQKITFAQAPFFSQVAIYFKVEDKKAKPGDIISKKDEKLLRSDRPYDPDLFGVVATNPVVTIGKPEKDALPIVISGITLVRVNGIFEPIKRGDYITSSDKPGVGRKAPVPGHVIGKALEDFDGEEGLILVLVQPQEANFEVRQSWEKISLWEAIGRIVTALERDVPRVLRYVFAIILASGSFILGYRAFMGNLREGIRGISRNPLARHSIRLAMILNLIGIVIITLAGLSLALFVILV